ncbi:major facilitator superfamily domain-containing protein [Syncephalastrum racemosum]|uniref:Major facilitator superfamily domain-containing protein n=1 Tax=Syncephalastrum racemosum TaxID=13706 RepID=A0A1X2HRD3_SYNRA|nr:major facilitator superfamily domain-containing protein [Syncephalastrum racemosum]
MHNHRSVKASNESASGYGTAASVSTVHGPSRGSLAPSSSQHSFAESSKTIEVVNGAGKVAHDSDGDCTLNGRYTNPLGSVKLSAFIACLYIVSALAAIDATILLIIQNHVTTEFHSSNLMAWIHASFLVGMTLTQPLAGSLSDIYGRRSLILVAVALFLAGSLACGAAASMLQLVVSRAIAGAGTGFIFTLPMIVVQDVIPKDLQAEHQSRLRVIQMVSIGLGGPVGGFINDYFGWRHCFYINIIPCVVAFAVFWRMDNYNCSNLEQKDTREKLRRIDYLGVILLSIFTTSFIFGTVYGGNIRPWQDPLVVIFLCSALAALSAFIMHEWSLPEDGKLLALMPRHLMTERNVLCSCLANYFLMAENLCLMFLFPQYYMAVRGLSVTATGLLNTPRVFSISLGAFLAGRFLRHHGYYKVSVIAATVSVTMDLSLICFMTANVPLAVIVLLKCLNSLCVNGVISIATVVSLTSCVPQKDHARAISMQSACRGVGQVFGTAVASSIFQYIFKESLIANINTPDAEETIEHIRTSIAKIHTLPPALQMIAENAVLSSVRYDLYFALFCAVCYFTSLASLRRK